MLNSSTSTSSSDIFFYQSLIESFGKDTLLILDLGLVYLLPKLNKAIESSPDQVDFLQLIMPVTYYPWLFPVLELINDSLTACIKFLSILG